jgi:UDP-N-acetylmuramate: L-alanyl-gamma-D-glutamyl-meso-diaminopimelate ligase
MHLHILGICGTFMGGIAAIAREAGHRVTGCDANVYPPMSTQLEALGIELIEGFDPKQIELKPDVFVIGNVVSRGNALMEEILDRGLAFTSGPQWLYENVLRGRWVLAVAGTHGKTTTSSMLAWILEHAGHKPGFLIGGIPQNFGISARLAASEYFVIEADEYDTAFFDKRSKFVHYHPRTTILNNLEYDHADIFPNLEAIETQFHHLVRTVPRNGLIVANGADANLARVLTRGCWSNVEYFNSIQGWSHKTDNTGDRIVILQADARCGELRWSVLGEHNAMNAVAAIAAAQHAGVPVEQSIDALARFENVKRRMEMRGSVNGITVYDDFAHHPTAITTTIAGLRKKVGSARILAVLDPRSNTMKRGVWANELAPSLADAQLVFCYTHGLGDWNPQAALAALGDKLFLSDQVDAHVEAVAREARRGDHILVMSNGGFGGIHEKLLKRLSKAA